MTKDEAREFLEGFCDALDGIGLDLNGNAEGLQNIIEEYAAKISNENH